MLAAAAHSLVGLVDPDKPGAAVLPPVKDMAKFSKTVAIAVAQSAIDQGFSSAKGRSKSGRKDDLGSEILILLTTIKSSYLVAFFLRNHYNSK